MRPPELLGLRSQRRGWIRADWTIRRWHPGYWVCAGFAWLRYVGVLPVLCFVCGGHGRVVKRAGLRRRRCRRCHGTGRLPR